MPDTTVQKMIGAITILISLMKPSPSALTQSLVAKSLKLPADEGAKHDGDQHLDVKNLVPGLRHTDRCCAVTVVGAIELTPHQSS